MTLPLNRLRLTNGHHLYKQAEFESSTLRAKFQNHRTFVFGEEDF